MPGGKELYSAQWRQLFDAGLATLKSIDPGKSIYYSMLRFRTFTTDFHQGKGKKCGDDAMMSGSSLIPRLRVWE